MQALPWKLDIKFSDASPAHYKTEFLILATVNIAILQITKIDDRRLGTDKYVKFSIGYSNIGDISKQKSIISNIILLQDGQKSLGDLSPGTYYVNIDGYTTKTSLIAQITGVIPGRTNDAITNEWIDDITDPPAKVPITPPPAVVTPPPTVITPPPTVVTPPPTDTGTTTVITKIDADNKTVGQAINNIAVSVHNDLRGVLGDIKAVGDKIDKSINDNVKTGLDAVAKGIATADAAVNDTITAGLTRLGNIIKNPLDTIGEFMTAGFDAVTAGLKAMYNKITDGIQAAIIWINDQINKAIGMLISGLTKIMDSLATDIWKGLIGVLFDKVE